MVKIPLGFSNEGYLYLKSLVKLPKIRIEGWIDFVVDTGSNVTFINEDDLIRLNIPFKILDKLEGQRQHTGLGGGTIEFRETRGAILICGDEDEEPVKFELKSLIIGKTARKKERERIAEPSIMGTDFLISHNLSLYFNPAKKEYYFEKY